MRAALIFVLSFLSSVSSFSQIINSSFIAPDTVCVNQTFTIQNTSTGSINSTYWNFCSSSVALTQSVNLGASATGFPTFASINNDVGTYYAFVSNNSPGGMSRFNFGGNLNGIPTSTNLGNFGGQLPGNCEGIVIEKEGGNWYGVTVGGPLGTISKMNFGTSLANLPTVVNLGNVGALSYPHRLRVIHSGGNKYGFTVNRNSGTITRFDFGNSLNNIPVGTNLGNIGILFQPNDFDIVYVNGNWHMFITNDGSNTLTRLDFGNNLLATPTGTNLGPIGVSPLRGISLDVTCEGIRGQVASQGNNFYNLNFPIGPTGVPTTSFIGNTGFSFPHSIEKYRIGDTVYTFVPNANSNSLSRLKYSNCSISAIANSTLTNLPPISFSVAGVYTISILNNNNQFNQSVFCKTIVVNTVTPISTAVNPSVVCGGSSATLTASGASSYTWSPGPITGSSIVITPTATSIYTVVGANGNCSDTKTIQINVNPNPNIAAFANSTFVCLGESATLSAFGAQTFTWNPGNLNGTPINPIPLVNTTYTVVGTNSLGCTNTAVVSVTVGLSPTINVAGSASIAACYGTTTGFAASGALNYTWTPGPGFLNIYTTTAFASTVFTVVGAVGSCTSSATATLIVNPLPTITAVASPTLRCLGSSGVTTLSASGGNTYTWSPALYMVGPPSGSIVTCIPPVPICYMVTGGNAFGCYSTAVVCVTVQPTPTVNINSIPGMICLGDAGSLEGSGATSYTWLPTSSNNTNIIVSPTTTTTYTLYGQTGACTGSMVSTVTVNPYPNLATLAFTPTLCIGKSTGILVSGASIYTWQPGSLSGFSVNVTPTVSTIYTITGSEFNCVSTTTVEVTVVQNPTIDIYPSPTITCISATQVATLTAGGASTFTWLPVSLTTQSIAASPSVSLVYSVSGTSPFGCVSQNSITLNVSPDLKVSSSATTICLGNTVNLNASGASSYSWMPGNLGQASVNVIPDANTSFTVVGANGICSQNKAIYIEVTQGIISEIPEVFTPNDDGKNDKFVIKTNTPAKIDMKVFNRWGAMVYSNNQYDNTWDGTANTGTLLGNSKLPQGTYFYIIDLESCDKQLTRGYVVIQY